MIFSGGWWVDIARKQVAYPWSLQIWRVHGNAWSKYKPYGRKTREPFFVCTLRGALTMQIREKRMVIESAPPSFFATLSRSGKSRILFYKQVFGETRPSLEPTVYRLKSRRAAGENPKEFDHVFTMKSLFRFRDEPLTVGCHSSIAFSTATRETCKKKFPC